MKYDKLVQIIGSCFSIFELQNFLLWGCPARGYVKLAPSNHRVKILAHPCSTWCPDHLVCTSSDVYMSIFQGAEFCGIHIFQMHSLLSCCSFCLRSTFTVDRNLLDAEVVKNVILLQSMKYFRCISLSGSVFYLEIVGLNETCINVM
jgi:hypothetical protein